MEADSAVPFRSLSLMSSVDGEINTLLTDGDNVWRLLWLMEPPILFLINSVTLFDACLF
jgi:hypothetical protein